MTRHARLLICLSASPPGNAPGGTSLGPIVRQDQGILGLDVVGTKDYPSGGGGSRAGRQYCIQDLEEQALVPLYVKTKESLVSMLLGPRIIPAGVGAAGQVGSTRTRRRADPSPTVRAGLGSEYSTVQYCTRSGFPSLYVSDLFNVTISTVLYRTSTSTRSGGIAARALQFEYRTVVANSTVRSGQGGVLKHIGTVLRPTCATRVPHVLHTGVPNDGV